MNILGLHACFTAQSHDPSAALLMDGRTIAATEEERLNRVKTSMTSVEQDVENRLRTAEEDIESINVYRLQTNQTLTTLQTSINTLQQRVGP